MLLAKFATDLSKKSRLNYDVFCVDAKFTEIQRVSVAMNHLRGKCAARTEDADFSMAGGGISII